MNKTTGSILSAIALALAAPALLAANSAPVAVPLAHNVPDAVDAPYPGGTLGLNIDATDVTRGIYRVTETIPVAPGKSELTLLFPQWLPGNHGPR
ncbi:MAG: peptidase M61, partial [Novosphingobium sp.]